MKFAPMLLAFALALSSPAQATADQFDLLCSGTIESNSAAGQKVEPFERHYRFDLSHGKYCEDRCRAIFDVVKVQPGSIIILADRVDTPSENSFLDLFIDRETGEYVGNSATIFRGRPEMALTIKWRGTCKSMPFSGFIQLPTKF